MLRDALLYPKTKSKTSTSCFRLPARMFRPSAPCCIYFLISLICFLVVTNVFHFSFVSVANKRTAWSRIPSMVTMDKDFAAKMTRDELADSNDDISKDTEKRQIRKMTIHFDDNLPTNDAHIREQANLTLAKLRTKTANWITPGENKQISVKVEKLSLSSTTTTTTTIKPTTTNPTTTTTEPTTTTKPTTTTTLNSPIATYPDQTMQQKKTLQRTKLYYNRYTNNPKYSSYYNASFKSPLPKQTKAIFLQTNYRSGSTFMGQLFNQHPHVFYTFEPLFMFNDKLSALLDVQLDVIKSNLQCDMTPAVDIFKQLTWNVKKSSVYVQCLLNNMCFRQKTKGLCDWSMCPTKDRRSACTACGPLDMERMNHLCRQHKMAATKVIRMKSISSLQSIMEDPTMDVKVIHLIRDPRGIASSRFRLRKKWEAVGITGTCDRLLRNAKLGESAETPEWLKGRYMKVRYEDLSRRPMEVASEIYDFAGLEFVPEMKKWINENTHASGTHRSPYSTDRDSAATSQAWRTQLTLDQVKSVQKQCGKTLDYFGYKPTWHQDELLNLNTTLVL